MRTLGTTFLAGVAVLVSAMTLIPAAATCDGGEPTPTPVVLDAGQVRVEARLVDGHLEERYLARAGARWIAIAEGSGESAGAVSVRDGRGGILGGAVRNITIEQGALVEKLAFGEYAITRRIEPAGISWIHVTTRLESGGKAELHSLADSFRFDGRPDWSYSPSVGGFNPDAQYKAPLILTQERRKAIAIVPDLAGLTREVLRLCPHVLDLDVPNGPRLTVGFVPARYHFHSVYQHDVDRFWTTEREMVNSYYLLVTADAAPGEAFRHAVRLHWEKFGHRELATASASQTGTDPAYRSLGLWDEWRNQVWEKESREQWLAVPLADGSQGGAVRTIRWGRPNPSIYMSAWFNSVRTALGMALYARRNGRGELLDLATGTIRLALAAPGRDGAFKCIALPSGDSVAWAAGDGAGSSIRNGYLGFDMSWTAYWLLKWRAAGFPEGDAILSRCRRLADFLLARQLSDGMIPTRFDESGAPQSELSRALMAETGPAALFLLELYSAQRDSRYLDAALRALGFLEREVIPERKWFDYETFFSCSPRTNAFDERTGQWPANNLALIGSVEAFQAAWRATGKSEYLARGEALLDYLLLYQQCWTNPVLEGLTGKSMLLGGFTTQNSDAEWSDARQSQAGNVLLDYYRATGKPEYLERGVSALRAQFPVSPSENWAHSGYGRKAGVSSFHWGTGSGMAGIELEDDFLRDAVVDLDAARAVGVNGIDIRECAIANDEVRLTLSSPFKWTRKPAVAFHGVPAGRRYRVVVNGVDLGVFAAADLGKGVAAPLPH
jgi:hypothetical protein